MRLLREHLHERDWFGGSVTPPLATSVAVEHSELIFSAKRAGSCLPHPASRENCFQAELWKYDLAEIFFWEPESEAYLEVNLAPTGGWWACWFDQVRVARQGQPDFAQVSASGMLSDEGWAASIRLPLSLFANPQTLQYNVTAIVDSPEQRFLSAYELGCTEPDFHRPASFHPLFSPDHS